MRAVVRGGNYWHGKEAHNYATYCHCHTAPTEYNKNSVGFRCVVDEEAKTRG